LRYNVFIAFSWFRKRAKQVPFANTVADKSELPGPRAIAIFPGNKRTAMSKITLWLQRVALVLLVAALVIAFDQWTKSWVRATIPDFTYIVPIEQLGDYFVFEHVHNYGAAFGILQNQGNLFIGIAIVVTIAILYYAGTLPLKQRQLRVLLGLQLGGALGNVIDRLYQGFVTDFVRVGIPGVYYWPNFNIADAAIVCGVIGLAIYVFSDDIRTQRQQRSAQSVESKVEERQPAPTQEL
jgi:signal peptidase II